MRLLRPQILVFAAFALSGCGTVANFASLKPKVYGGLDQDTAFLESGKFHGPRNGGTNSGSPWAPVFLLGLLPAELCCTFLADTVTLPLTMMLDDDWRLKEAKKPPPEPRRPAIAYGINGPYLWNDTLDGPKVSGDERDSKEAEKPLPEPHRLPIGCLIDWPQLWRAGPMEPNSGGEPPSS